MSKVSVHVMLKPEILDAAGQAIERSLPSLDIANINGVSSVRIGKRIELEIDDSQVADPKALGEELAQQLLANPMLEVFDVQVENQ